MSSGILSEMLSCVGKVRFRENNDGEEAATGGKKKARFADSDYDAGRRLNTKTP